MIVDPVDTPKPPSLHWGIVLALSLLTGGLFAAVWMFVQAAWVRRFDPKPRALYILAIGFSVVFLIALTTDENQGGIQALLALIGDLVGFATVITAYFDMRSAIEARFNLRLSSPMTFFFNVIYLQYYMRRIARGEHVPHSDRILA